MLKKLTSSYYSKMLLTCIIMVCTITISLFSLSSSLIKNKEKSDYLRDYEIELSNLSSILASKIDSLANNLAPVFSSNTRYHDLCSFYKKDGQINSALYYSIVQMSQEICRYNQYCRGILFRTNHGNLFQYNINYDTIVPLSSSHNSFDFAPYQLQILTDSQLTSLSDNFEKSDDHIYGLSATIFDYDSEQLTSFGQLIILYSSSEFTNSVTITHMDERSIFSIVDDKNHIIYSSDGSYPADTSRKPMDMPSTEKENSKYYHASIYNPKYAYHTTYKVPSNLIKRSYIQITLALLAVIICLSIILIYLFFIRNTEKKTRVIQNAMTLVGKNNLDYRLNVPKSNDEFTKIAISFNRMCDELQQNVEKAYIYEISEKKAELYAMQTSINPHFLYNTLEQIRVQIMQGKYSAASQMLLLLSKLYRNQTRRKFYVSIGEELSLCENLINLYLCRYDNFEYEFIISNSLKIYGIPKNTLQPLIENFFSHGLIHERDDNLLTIMIQTIVIEGKEYLEFQIEDNGITISAEEQRLLEEKLAQPVLSRNEDNGFALSNVNTRLKLVFGNDSRLHIGTRDSKEGFRVSFMIPPILPEDLGE